MEASRAQYDGEATQRRFEGLQFAENADSQGESDVEMLAAGTFE